jgi:uncharacterized membrane protein YciS (DUF1049 family)
VSSLTTLWSRGHISEFHGGSPIIFSQGFSPGSLVFNLGYQRDNIKMKKKGRKKRRKMEKEKDHYNDYPYTYNE